MKLAFRPGAERHIDEAREWYGAHSPDLEERFAATLADTLSTVLDHPLAFQEVERGVRRAPLPVFPYVVYYRPTAQAVRVLAVLHTKRHPETWKTR